MIFSENSLNESNLSKDKLQRRQISKWIKTVESNIRNLKENSNIENNINTKFILESANKDYNKITAAILEYTVNNKIGTPYINSGNPFLPKKELKSYASAISTNMSLLESLKELRDSIMEQNDECDDFYNAYANAQHCKCHEYSDDFFGGLDIELNRTIPLDDDEKEKFYTYPEFNKAISEHMDIVDTKTRKALVNLSEESQESVLTALTSKLYDNIAKKANEINYGDIPLTKGDISKLPNYDKLRETIVILKDIVKEYRQDSAPIDTLAEAMSNVETRKDLFERAYRYDIELPMLMYNTTVLSIITGVSYMISVCIEFIKSPKDETFDTVLDTVAYKKSKEHLIYNSLKKFNKSCSSGDFDKSMNYLIDSKTKKLTGTIFMVGGIAIVALILNIIPILREMIFFFYYARTSISDFFDVQADLLQMNAYNIEHNETRDAEERKTIAEKQIKICELFRNIARKIAVDSKQAEARSVSDTSKENKKLKIDDLASEETVSALF